MAISSIAFSSTAFASSVTPARLPLPLPGDTPLPPDRLRAANPWNLPMNGLWKFQLTRGQVVDGRFARSSVDAIGFRVSGSQGGNTPENAFDGDPKTRWCAPNGDFPQWIQVDLKQERTVSAVNLLWERDTETYRCKVEGSADARVWTPLSQPSTAEGAGVGNGTLAITPRAVRYVRLTVLGTTGTGWASLYELGVQYKDDQGNLVTWRPGAPDLSPPPHADDFVQPDYDDRKWDNLQTPSNWEMAGYSIPTYDAVDDAVGQYRRWVTVPASWAGRKIIWRFDGAFNGAEIFVNGRKAGYHESGYTAFDVDLTGLVKPGQRNLFAVRLSKTTPSSECETGDYQSLGGIYRDTSLIAAPKTHVSDITVRTPLTNNYQDATLDASVSVEGEPGATVQLSGILTDAAGNPTSVRLSGTAQIGADGTGAVALSAPVTSPRLWSAEKPALYYVVLNLTQNGKSVERVEQRFGFRQVTIQDNVVLWNGKAIKTTGICRHDFWADKGFALTDKEWSQDLTMMKAANINAIRTSHYNHAARFLELCDEKGMYILDEVPFCWIDDHVKDPKFNAPLLSRAADTVGRDKNRACVLAWSLGNENPVGPNTQDVFDLVQKLDPTRPAFASGAGPWDVKGQPIRDTHYPGPDFFQHYIDVDSAKAPLVVTEHPHTFYSKEQQEYDPGISDLWSETLIKTWDILWKQPKILGSFIWEWQCQGIADKFPDHETEFYYGTDHMRQENNKGIVSAYRVPKPELWIVKNVYSPVVVGARTINPAGGVCTVPITNHYTFTDLSEITCRWTVLDGDKALKTGTLKLSCAPMQSTDASFPALDGMTALRLQFLRADGTEITSSRLLVTGTPSPAAPPALSSGATLATNDASDTLSVTNTLQSVVFDKHTGMIQKWTVNGRDLIASASVLNFGESKKARGDGFYRAPQPPATQNASVTAAAQSNGAVRVTVASQVVSKAGGDNLAKLTTVYDIQPNAEISVAWTLDWTAAATELWEAGLSIPVAPSLSEMRWSRDAYFTDYPKGNLGEPAGECHAGDTRFLASKSSLHWLTLTGADGAGVALLRGDTPLVGRARSASGGVTLLASSRIAASGPDDLSRSWMRDHEIEVGPGKPLTGAFVLRAVGK
ncbi:glycoside hydrolase family 2 TIM barrel-domain containing protein [Capsulimonas corticalis]|uniref:glycoside hydrolase family 2 TIM barrel-domain containing protein n=1 Tax=Capsulimonas corticalis TaxID=2219043 RepID=UPI001403F497|nr:glycoside hydrolase family 2 TIM barrel-domain containing protein [Capsulimonas corticalis]